MSTDQHAAAEPTQELTDRTRYAGYSSYQYLTAGQDYRSFQLAPEFGRVAPWDRNLTSEQAARADLLLAESMVISLHDHPVRFPQDITETRQYHRTARVHTGFAGLAASGMNVVFDNLMDGTACVTSNAGWKWDDVIYDIGMRRSDVAHQDYVTIASDVRDLERARKDGQLALVLSLEASTPIENELDRIDILYGIGVRQMGIAYSEANTLGSGLKERHDGGLTRFGEKAVARMNALGVAIDVSHSGDRTSMDTIEASTVPVFITHAGARSVWPTPRMKPDEVLRACAERGGVLGLEAAPHTTLSPQHLSHSLESVMDHFVYCVDLLGIEHVAFGPDTLFGDHVGLHHEFVSNLGVHEAHGAQVAPDFDEVNYVAGLENPVENFANIIGWLVSHGYSDDEIRAVVGGNVMRVLKQVWA